MSNSLLHPDLKQVLARRAGRPYRFVDPETNAVYVLMGAEYFDQLAPGQADPQAGEAAGGVRDESEFPAIGTPEWGQMNRRRAELIRKKLREELSGDERGEYERLQRRSLESVDAAFRFQAPCSVTADPAHSVAAALAAQAGLAIGWAEMDEYDNYPDAPE
jgi:hypothetical protein